MKRIKVLINGIVQGVNFRSSIFDVARDLGIRGYVKNLDDGNVECVFEGSEQEIEEMIRYCKKGPEDADVEEVDVKVVEYEAEFDDFEIRY